MQMAARTKAKTRGTYAPQPKAAPVEDKKPAPKPAPPLNSIQVKDDEGDKLNAGLTQYGLRVPKFGEHGEAGFHLDEGVIPRRWARESSTVMALARRLAAKNESFERVAASTDEARAKAKEERAEAKAAVYRGMIHLRALLQELGEKAPSEGRAKKAIERAHMIHRKFHFGPKEVEQARKILREMPAAVNPFARAAGAGGTARQAAPAPAGIVAVLVKENPHRAGSVQYDRMAALMAHANKPVADYLGAGGCRLKLKNALEKGWVRLDQEAPATVAPAKSASSGATRDAKKAPPVKVSETVKPTGTAKKAVPPAKAKKSKRK